VLCPNGRKKEFRAEKDGIKVRAEGTDQGKKKSLKFLAEGKRILNLFKEREKSI